MGASMQGARYELLRIFLYDVWLIRSNGRRREATTADEQRSPPLRLT
jgi:hypothetical protein